MINWNKKGITPLMATFLLISFAVALGVVFMNLGRAQVESSAQCAVNIDLKFSEISGQKQICYDGQQVRFTVENGVNIKVSGLIVNVIGQSKADSFELNDAQIVKAGTYLGKVSYNQNVAGSIRQVKITPKVFLYDEEQICIEKALVVENLPSC